MKKKLDKTLSIFILGENDLSSMQYCIKYAAKLTKKIFFVDPGLTNENIVKIREWRARIVGLDSFASALQTDWILFIRPKERPVLSSAKTFRHALRNKQRLGYGVFTKSVSAQDSLKDYQWVKKLEQFRDVGNSAYIPMIEPRLVRKSYAKSCLEGLTTGNNEEVSWVCANIVHGVVIESFPVKKPDPAESVREYDMRCLKGEVVYDITPEEDMVELSERYTGFRIVHKGHLEGFMDAAGHGFGHIKMYIPLLDFLCKEGFFEEAKNLFEQWIEHRPDDKENYNTQLMGGMIYSNLLEIDKAIEWFAKITETSESALACANLGKLYLIKGEKNKAIEHLEMSKDIEGDIFLKKRILSVIDGEEWEPLKLSLCMIARDEETTIGKLLRSVENIVDEIIVVETGSSDKTREIVREYGGKVFETEWKNDFSKAKNVALEQATGDYILFMDADEFIDHRDKFALALFKKFLPIEKNIAFGLKISPAKGAKRMSMAQIDLLTDQKEDSYQIRLFPRKPGIEFQGKVFESLDESLKSAGVQVTRNDLFKITHSMEERERRDERKMPAALNAFEAIHDPQKILKGGLLFLRLGELDSAYPWLIKVCELDAKLSAKIGTLYSKQNKPEMAKEILTGALKQFPDSSELILSMAEVYYKEKNYSEVVNLIGERIEKIDKDLKLEEEAVARYYLGIASIETGDAAHGIEQLAIAHEKNPSNICYKIAGIYAFSKVGQWEEAFQVAAQIVYEEEIDIPGEVNDFVDVGQVFVEMNHYFMQAGKTEEANLCRKIVEDVVKTKVSGEEDIQRMSAVIEGYASY